MKRLRIVVPVVVLSERPNELDKVLLLKLGTDDQVTKSFNPRDLLARVRAAMRRGFEHSLPEFENVKFGDASVDFSRMEAIFAGKPVSLTVGEFKMLHFLVHHEDRVVQRGDLTEILGHDASPKTRTMDNLILGLRRKLEIDPAIPQHILTVHGLGYRFASSGRAEK